MSAEKEMIKCRASCPVCGRSLCRATPQSVVEIYCPKCKNPLLVSFENNCVSVKMLANDAYIETGMSESKTIC